MRAKITTKLNVPPTPVGQNLVVQLPIEVMLTECNDEIPGIETIKITVDKISETKIRPVEITVKAMPGHEVRGTDLREVQVTNWAVHAVASRLMAIERQPDGTAHAIMGEYSPISYTDEEQSQIRLDGPVESSLRAVANIYSFADAVGIPPARRVELQLGLPRTTASKWIRRAREAGFLDEEV